MNGNIENLNKIIVVFAFCILSCNMQNTEANTIKSIIGISEEPIPENVKLLIKSYPNNIIGYSKNKLYFKDSTFLVYDDGIKNKSFIDLLNNPDIEDQFLL